MRIAALILIGLQLAGPVLAQSPGPHQQRVVTTSRLVALFSGMERELATALQQNDQAALDRLLSDDFEVWMPEPGGYPTPREDWLPRNSGPKGGPVTMRQFAVKDLGGSRVVSFVMGRSTGDAFVIDIWQDTGNGTWKLTDRYLSEIPKRP